MDVTMQKFRIRIVCLHKLFSVLLINATSNASCFILMMMSQLQQGQNRTRKDGGVTLIIMAMVLIS